MKTFILLTTILLMGAIAGCDDAQTDDGCDPASCEAWEQCINGDCTPLEGLCTTYRDCTATEYCDEEEHICKGPTLPDPSFFDGDGDRLLFSYRGRIGSDDSYAMGSSPVGQATFTWRTEAQEVVLDYYAYASLVPESMLSDSPSWSDHHAIIVGASHTISQNLQASQYYSVSLGLAKEELASWRASRQFIGEVPHPVWATLYKISNFEREDRVHFSAVCPISWIDETTTAGRLFLFAPENESFDAGEPLMVWGNLPLAPMLPPEEENLYCNYTRDGAAITAQEYEEGIASSGYELTCELPEEVSQPTAPDWLTLIFSGTINDPAVGLANFAKGMGTAAVSLQGVSHSTADYYTLSYLYPVEGRDFVFVQGLGSIEVLGADHYRYKLMRLMISQESLLALRDSGDATMLPVSHEVMVTVDSNESLVYNGVNFYRVCPMAVADPVAPSGLVGSCFTDQSTFDYGDTFEVAATVNLTTEQAAQEAWHGTFDGCYCYMSIESNRIDCTQFDTYAQGGGK